MLGMWHCADPRFVMHAGSREFPLEFDPQSAELVVITRDLDFARGAEWLDAGKRRRLDAIFRWGHAPNTQLPYVDAELREAWRLVYTEGDVVAGRAIYRRALADQQRCMGRADSTLIRCLCRLAWAELSDPEKNVKEAERLARRVQRIVRASGCPSDPPLDEEWILADVDWARGRREESIERLRYVHATRVKALGASNGDTADVKDVLDWRVRQMQPLIAPVGTK